MFNYPVSVMPPFSGDVRDKICGVSDFPSRDDTLFMTMTTLFYKRIPDLKIFNKFYNTTFEGNYESHMDLGPKDALSFYWFPLSENPEPKLKMEHKSFDKHDAFLTKRLGQNIYIKVFGSRTVAVFYETGFSLELFHSIQALTAVCFKEYFEKDPLTETEKDLLVSLTSSNDVFYRREIQKLLENEDLKRFLLKSKLIGLEKDLRKQKFEEALNNANNCLDEMHSYLDAYRKACERKNEFDALAIGLKAKVDEVEENTEFEEYLCSNKLLSDIKIDNGKISYVVRTFVNPYLPDEWDSLSKKGYIFEGYRKANNCLDDEQNLKLLLDAIFSKDHTLKLRICGYITLDYYGSHVSSVRDYNFTEYNPALKNYIPNAHLNRHNCFGQNMDDILTQLQDGDLIGAVECTINVVKRMNVCESASFVPFVESLKQSKGKCIVTEDGQELTCEEAIKYLKEKNDETTSNTNGETSVA